MTNANRVKRPTSLDVARLAGVSHTTVSFVINDVTSAGISEETRARVLQAVAQLDYHPHEAARSLRSKASHILGVAIPEYNPHHLEIAAGIDHYAQEHGYNTSLFITDFTLKKELQCLQWLKQRRFDALVLSPGTGSQVTDELHFLAKQGYPITMIGIQDRVLDGVGIEKNVGEQQLLQHLADLGHRTIGYIYGVADQEIFGGRLAACLQAQRALNLAVHEEWIWRCGPTIQDGYQAAQLMLAQTHSTERPTALVVVNDALAGAVLAALYHEGIDVPTMMSVASFDNTQLAAFAIPPLTTVDCEATHMGEAAARITIARLAESDLPRCYLATQARLIVRGSTGPAPEQEIASMRHEAEVHLD